MTFCKSRQKPQSSQNFGQSWILVRFAKMAGFWPEPESSTALAETVGSKQQTDDDVHVWFIYHCGAADHTNTCRRTERSRSRV